MKFRQLATGTALAALLAGGAGVQAAIVSFDNPAAIVITGNTATYSESGYAFSGQAADFLLLDDGMGDGFLVGGFFGAQPISLTLAGGGSFGLLGLDLGFFDLGDPAGTLDIIGLLNGQTMAMRSVALGAETTLAFNANWAALTEVRFSAGSGFTLDNVSVVPEPGSLALVTAGLVGLVGLRLRRRQTPGAAA